MTETVKAPSPAVRPVLLAWIARRPHPVGSIRPRRGALWTDGVYLAWRGRVIARHTSTGAPEIWRGYVRSPEQWGYRPWTVRELVSHLLRLFPGALIYPEPGPKLEDLSPEPGRGMLPYPMHTTFPRPLGVLEHES